MDLINGIDAWLLWGLAAIALFILELFTPGFVLACFGIGAGFAVFPALVGLGLTWQLIFFAIGRSLTIQSAKNLLDYLILLAVSLYKIHIPF